MIRERIQYCISRLQNLISAESGWNDGLGYPFVLLAILILQRSP
jgi:NhaP-type Na+/H+ or K+/H+ antiporter